MYYSVILYFLCTLSVISSVTAQDAQNQILTHDSIHYGADQFILDTAAWKGKKMALVVNQTSILSDHSHLVDALVANNSDIQWIYSPEHGFRGQADAGKLIHDEKDTKTGIPLRSLYGAKKKPDPEELKQLDLIVFDLQDVGVRFYTYLSTMYYVMEAAAEAGCPMVILDRPNPNGYFVDGPVLDTAFSSFVGIIPIPVVHGMTLGELAQFIKGEGLIKKADRLDLKIYKCLGYRHELTFELPVKPSPNLPNLRSILLYPSLCYFEATRVSIGRGTKKQFQVIGSPYLKNEYDFTFTPQPMPGAAHPKFEGLECFGIDLSEMNNDTLLDQGAIQWKYLFTISNQFKEIEMIDREDFMNLLMGTDEWIGFLKNNDMDGWISSYQEELKVFKEVRKKYLLY